jgi:hypothetical protein
VLALFFLGGDVLHDFSFAMLVGVVHSRGRGGAPSPGLPKVPLSPSPGLRGGTSAPRAAPRSGSR